MARSISKRNSAKASKSKPSFKSPPMYKTLGIEPAIRLYLIKDGDKNEEGEYE